MNQRDHDSDMRPEEMVKQAMKDEVTIALEILVASLFGTNKSVGGNFEVNGKRYEFHLKELPIDLNDDGNDMWPEVTK